jgi:hypothetical protein
MVRDPRAFVWTRQDRNPRRPTVGHITTALAPGLESLRAVRMYLTQLQPQSSPQVTSEDIILPRVRSLSVRPSVNILYTGVNTGTTGSYMRSKLIICVHDARAGEAPDEMDEDGGHWALLAHHQ